MEQIELQNEQDVSLERSVAGNNLVYIIVYYVGDIHI